MELNTELKMLFCSIVLGFIQISLAIRAATKIRGIDWNMSSRDEPMPPLTGIAGRLSRASENFKETFPLFLGAVMLVQFLNKNSEVTAAGAQLYFWARVVYVPLYAYDIIRVRTLVWTVATCGILLILAGVIL